MFFWVKIEINNIMFWIIGLSLFLSIIFLAANHQCSNKWLQPLAVLLLDQQLYVVFLKTTLNFTMEFVSYIVRSFLFPFRVTLSDTLSPECFQAAVANQKPNQLHQQLPQLLNQVINHSNKEMDHAHGKSNSFCNVLKIKLISLCVKDSTKQCVNVKHPII